LIKFKLKRIVAAKSNKQGVREMRKKIATLLAVAIGYFYGLGDIITE